jgi:hypothetical protein
VKNILPIIVFIGKRLVGIRCINIDRISDRGKDVKRYGASDADIMRWLGSEFIQYITSVFSLY